MDAPGGLTLTLGYRDEQALADAVAELVDARVASGIAGQDATLWVPTQSPRRRSGCPGSAWPSPLDRCWRRSTRSGRNSPPKVSTT